MSSKKRGSAKAAAAAESTETEPSTTENPAVADAKPARATPKRAASAKASAAISPTQLTLTSMFKTPESKKSSASAPDDQNKSESTPTKPMQIVPMFTTLESPSKEPLSAPSNQSETTPSPAPKKRGRKPKTPATPGAGTLNFEPAASPGDSPSKPKSAKKASKAKNTEELDDSENPPPAKRRKVSETNETATDAMDVDTTPVASGPRKAKAKAKSALKADDDDDDSDASADEDSDNNDSENDEDDDEDKKKTPKKKATPKKASSSAKKSSATKPKKAKKNKDSNDEDADVPDGSDDDASDGDQDGEDGGASAAPKKRGRAAKSNESYFQAFVGDTKKNIEKIVSDMAKRDKDILFPRWFPTKSAIKFITDNVNDYLPHNAKSRDFAFRKPELSPTEPAHGARKLDRFDSVSNTHIFKDTQYDDALIFTGGPIWGLDWCPRTGDSAQRQFLAISSHKSENDLHVYGTAYHANNIIQIWDCGSLSRTGAKTLKSPKMVFGIAHDGGCAFEVHWCPAGTPSDVDVQLSHEHTPKDAIPRLGLLGGVFADGSVRVWSVPHPDYVTAPVGFEGPLVLDLKPVQVFSAVHASSTLFCTMSWSPVGNCERIAAGSHNGIMAVFRLTDDPVARAEKILSLSPWGLSLEEQASAAAKLSSPQADEQPVQRATSASDDEGLEWDIPFEPAPFMTYNVSRVDAPELFHAAHRTSIRKIACSPKNASLVVTAGLDTEFYVWDISQPAGPILVRNSNSGLLTCADWTVSFDYESIFVGVSDGEIRHNSPVHGRVFKCHSGAVWGLHVSPVCRMIASCGSDGSVSIFPLLGDSLLNGQRRRQLPDPTDIDRLKVHFDVLEFNEGAPPAISMRPPVVTKEQFPHLPQKGRPKKSLKKMTPEEKKEHKKQLAKDRAERRKELKRIAKEEGGAFVPESKDSAADGAPADPIPFPPFEVGLFRIKWNLHPSAANWIAYGGHAGLLRIRLVSSGIEY